MATARSASFGSFGSFGLGMLMLQGDSVLPGHPNHDNFNDNHAWVVFWKVYRFWRISDSHPALAKPLALAQRPPWDTKSRVVFCDPKLTNHGENEGSLGCRGCNLHPYQAFCWMQIKAWMLEVLASYGTSQKDDLAVDLLKLKSRCLW